MNKKEKELRLRLFTPMCYNYGHFFIRDSFLGVSIGKPYCMRCGKRGE